MIQLPPQLRIMLAYEPVDFRKGSDSLAALCRNRLNHDPFYGTVFFLRAHTPRGARPYKPQRYVVRGRVVAPALQLVLSRVPLVATADLRRTAPR